LTITSGVIFMLNLSGTIAVEKSPQGVWDLMNNHSVRSVFDAIWRWHDGHGRLKSRDVGKIALRLASQYVKENYKLLTTLQIERNRTGVIEDAGRKSTAASRGNKGGVPSTVVSRCGSEVGRPKAITLDQGNDSSVQLLEPAARTTEAQAMP
jgi:hypothetical protein